MGRLVRLATWNLNHRVGKTRFRPEAAMAASRLPADIVVFTEYYPGRHHDSFLRDLGAGGLGMTFLSRATEEVANQVLVASRVLVEGADLDLPTFDLQFPANVLAVRVPQVGLRLVGLRIPAYVGEDRGKIKKSWDWIEEAAATLRELPAVILGDLNVQVSSPGRVGDQFRRLLETGWMRAEPSGGYSYFGHTGARTEIDHVLVSPRCQVTSAEYITYVGGCELAGSQTALSDHAALIVEVDVPQGRDD